IDLAVGKTTYPSSIAAVSKEETRTAILFRSISDVPQIEVGGGLEFHRSPTGGPIVKNEVWTRRDALIATAERSDDLNLEPRLDSEVGKATQGSERAGPGANVGDHRVEDMVN